MTLMAIMVICSYGFFYNKACRDKEYYESHLDEYHTEISDSVSKMIWVMFLILAVLFFTVGCIMILRLRTYYKDFYKDFAC